MATLPLSPIVADPAIIDRLAVQWMAFDAEHAERISKGAEIAKAGFVERTSVPFRFLVVSQSNPDSGFYLVEHGVCNCPDAATRNAHECKHCQGVRLAVQAERADAEQSDPTPIAITVEPEDEAIPYTLGLRGRLGGEPCDLPPQCSRCHAEAAILTHPDHLGRVCLLAETFGEGV